jgi:hypothetical protein
MNQWVRACAFGVVLVLWLSFFWARYVKRPKGLHFDRWIVSEFQFSIFSIVLGGCLISGRSIMGGDTLGIIACCAGFLVLGTHFFVEHVAPSISRSLSRRNDKRPD